MKKIGLFLVLMFSCCALSFGQSAEEYVKRGVSKQEREDFRGALEDFNKAIEKFNEYKQQTTLF